MAGVGPEDYIYSCASIGAALFIILQNVNFILLMADERDII